MAPKLKLGVGEFAQGVISYRDSLPFQTHHRSYIIIPVTFGTGFYTSAVVDTGAEFCILGPEEAAKIDISYFSQGSRLIGGGDYDGRYGHTSARLEADEGESVELNMTVWVPRLRYGQVWPHPNLIGLTGFLEKVRFAVDPEYNQFYFGVFGEDSA